MRTFNITSAQYVAEIDGSNSNIISANIDGVDCFVPVDTDNQHYVAIKAKHDDSDDSFTIQDAS